MLSPVPSRPRDPRVDSALIYPALIDPALIDAALHEEVDLLTRLIAAANASLWPLDAAALDAALFGDEPDGTTTPS